jgi:hypothetical protein
MVEERIMNDEVEDRSFFDTICDDCNHDNSKEEDLDDRGYDNHRVNRYGKSKMVHGRWAELYDYEGSKELKDSMNGHLNCTARSMEMIP